VPFDEDITRSPPHKGKWGCKGRTRRFNFPAGRVIVFDESGVFIVVEVVDDVFAAFGVSGCFSSPDDEEDGDEEVRMSTSAKVVLL